MQCNKHTAEAGLHDKHTAEAGLHDKHTAEAGLHACLQVFERETNREKNLEKAVKEAKVKARKEAAKTSESDKDRALDEQDILKVLLHTSWQFSFITYVSFSGVRYV